MSKFSELIHKRIAAGDLPILTMYAPTVSVTNKVIADLKSPISSRRPRRPSIRTIIKQAEQAEKVVASITTPDGFTITFNPNDDKAIQTADDELAQWRKRRRNAHSS